jgi:hypothetical protein
LSAPLDRLTTRDAESIRNDRRRCSPSHPVQSGLSKPLLSVQTVDERQISEELFKSPPALRILSNLLLGSPARSEVRAYGGRGHKHLRRRPADREPGDKTLAGHRISNCNYRGRGRQRLARFKLADDSFATEIIEVELYGVPWGGSLDGTTFVYSPLTDIEKDLGELLVN